MLGNVLFRLHLGTTASPLLYGAVAAWGFQEPVPVPSTEPLKARSAEANVSFGQIQRDQPMRLDVRDRIQAETGIGPVGGNLFPVDLPPEQDFPNQPSPSLRADPDPTGTPIAKIDTTPVPPVELGLETRLSDAGLLVVRVSPEKPGAAAGLKPQDRIRRAGDRAVLTEKDLHETLRRYPAAASVPLEVDRGDEKLQLNLTLPADHRPYISPPVTIAPAIIAAEPAPVDVKDVIRDDVLGWSLTEYSDNVMGVPVVAVLPGGPAALAGVLERDVIMGVDGVACRDARSVSYAVHRHPAGNRAVLWVKRGLQSGVIPLQVPAASVTPVVPSAAVIPTTPGTAVVPVVPVAPVAVPAPTAQ